MVGRPPTDHLPTTFLRCSLFTITILVCNENNVLTIHQSRVFSAYTLLYRVACMLHSHLQLLFRWLAVSMNKEMAVMSGELVNDTDFYFCYIIKTFIMSSSNCTNKNATALLRHKHQSSNCPLL